MRKKIIPLALSLLMLNVYLPTDIFADENVINIVEYSDYTDFINSEIKMGVEPRYDYEYYFDNTISGYGRVAPKEFYIDDYMIGNALYKGTVYLQGSGSYNPSNQRYSGHYKGTLVLCAVFVK